MHTKLLVSGLITILLACITVITLVLIKDSQLPPVRVIPTASPTPRIVVTQVPLIAGNTNLTTQFNTLYPQEQRTQAQKVQFAQSQPLVIDLPTIDEATIRPGESAPKAVKAYLLQAFRRDILTDKEGIPRALQALLHNNNTAPLYEVRASWATYQQLLFTTSVPPQAVALHKSLIGYTELVIKTFDQIALSETDPIKSLTAMYQLEILDRLYYPPLVMVADELEKQ